MSPGCRRAAGFTLIEVMVAIAILGTALAGLLGLHHQSLQSVIRAQQTTQAAMLAQTVMTQAELERFPAIGATHGDFNQIFPNQFPGFRWERVVEGSNDFPDVRRVRIAVYYGPRQNESFTLTEFMHSPTPPEGSEGAGEESAEP